MSKKSEARREEIAKWILEKGEVKSEELEAMFSVSNETIRKDLLYLESVGTIRKDRGVAKAEYEYNELPVMIKRTENVSQKRAIARSAIDFIEDGATIYLDGGSTCITIAMFLRLKKNITVVTNSLEVASLVTESDNEVLLIGGNVLKKSKSSVGSFALDLIGSIAIDVSFNGCDGFKGFDGPTTFNAEEIEIKKKILERSRKHILVCDSSKFEKTGTYKFANFSDFDVMITDMNDAVKLKTVKGIGQVKTVR